MRGLIVFLVVPTFAGCVTAHRAAPPARAFVDRLPRQGEPVRVVIAAKRAAPERLVYGSFQRLTGDTAILGRQEPLGPGGLQLDTVPLRGSGELQVLLRRHRHAAAGFGIGVLVGAATGGVIASVAIEDNPYPLSKSSGVAVAAAGGAVVCGIVGALIGHNVGTDEWATVDLGRLSVTTTVGQFGVRVAF